MLSSYTDAVKLTYSSTPEETSPFQGIQTPQTSSSAWQTLQCHDPDSEIVPWMTRPGKREVSLNEKWFGFAQVFLKPIKRKQLLEIQESRLKSIL